MSSHPPAVAERMGAIGQGGYLGRLGARISAVGSSLCLGVDPHPDALPVGFSRDVAGVERFAQLILEVALPRAAAVKFNVAFYEAFGSAGIAALERLRARVPAEVPFIADAKRGDIASTVERQMVAIFDALGADAVTLNPYLGRDSLEPFLARTDRFAYILCRTSNSGAAEFQGLTVDGQPLYIAVARRVARWADAGAQVGLVVGATAPPGARPDTRRSNGAASARPWSGRAGWRPGGGPHCGAGNIRGCGGNPWWRAARQRVARHRGGRPRVC